jgi:hypothetical protein
VRLACRDFAMSSWPDMKGLGLREQACHAPGGFESAYEGFCCPRLGWDDDGVSSGSSLLPWHCCACAVILLSYVWLHNAREVGALLPNSVVHKHCGVFASCSLPTHQLRVQVGWWDLECCQGEPCCQRRQGVVCQQHANSMSLPKVPKCTL